MLGQLFSYYRQPSIQPQQQLCRPRNNFTLVYPSCQMLIINLPVDLIAEILGELDLDSLIKTSYACKQFHSVASDTSLNPWRRPILRNLRSTLYESALKHLSVRSIVPRQNWVDILSVARPFFILYEATLPNLKSSEWEECYKRRFLPGWRKWRKDTPWKETFLKLAFIIHTFVREY